MSNTEIEIVVDDPTAPEADSPPVTDTRVAEIVVSLLLIAVAGQETRGRDLRELDLPRTTPTAQR